MRTGFYIEELARLQKCGLAIKDDFGGDITLAAVEAECIEMCKRKWPDHGQPAPFVIIEFDDVDCHYRLYVMIDDCQECFEATHANRPAALVELVEKIKEAI